MLKPVRAFVLRPGPQHRYRPPSKAIEEAADTARAILIDRMDDSCAGGEIKELLDLIEPCLETLGYSRLDVINAFQNTLFPEAFLPGDLIELPGLIPKSGPPRAGLERLMAFVESVREKAKRE